MKKLGINSQRAEYFAQDWLTARKNGKTGLYDYYANPSTIKERAMDDLKVKFLTYGAILATTVTICRMTTDQ